MAGRPGQPDPDLFQPTVGTKAADYDPLPWRPESNFYVAFFGGIIPATAIAFVNARRLKAPQAAWIILALGAVAFVAFLAVGYNLDQNAVSGDDASRYARLGARIGGVVLHFAFMGLLKRPSRRFQVVRGDDYAPMWGPGLAAGLIGGIVQACVLLGVMGEL